MWTDRSIKAFKPRTTRYRLSEDTNQRGVGRLVLDIQPSGVKTFYFQYFRDGARKYSKIGVYKQSAKEPGYTLSEARERSLEYSDIHKRGRDVQLYLEEQKHTERERIRQLEIARNQGTFEQLLDSYLSNLEMRKKRSISNIRHALKLYVRKPFPELLGKNSNEITSTHISLILRRMMDKGITTQSNRVRSMLHAAFQHGIAQDNDPRRYKEEGVLFGLLLNPVPKQPDFERTGEHVISEDEIKLIWEALPNQTPTIESVIKLALITGQRPGEIIRLRWEDFDIKEKTILIPSSISKNSIDHIVPLAALGIRVVKELKKETCEFDYAFPGVKSGYYNNKTHINTTTIAKAVREICKEEKDVTKFVPRDIRRTVKTLMGKAGISKELRDRIQNHALTDVSAKHYDRYDYMKEKRHGLTIWNDYLELIISPRKKVTHIRKKRA